MPFAIRERFQSPGGRQSSRLGISGGNAYEPTESDFAFLLQVVARQLPDEIVTEGRAGFDAAIEQWARALGFQIAVEPSPPPGRWGNGRPRPPVNRALIERIDAIAVFPGSTRTRALIGLAKEMGKHVFESPSADVAGSLTVQGRKRRTKRTGL